MFNKAKQTSQSAANVVDGKLILSFPEALTPIVWQIDLNDAKSSAFEVTEENGTYTLISRKQGAQKKEVIAPFENKDKAVQALMATSQALAHAHGHIQTAPESNTNVVSSQTPQHVTYATAPTTQKGGMGKWIFAAISVILIVGLFSLANSLQPRTPSSMASANANAGDFGQNAGSAAGVPVSADEFLRQR